MPLFAVANAGVPLTGMPADMSVALAAGLGLAIGKPVGITLAAWLTVRAGLASLPLRVSWMTLHACAWLGGIGFTMSLFIATLAFGGTGLLDAAKIGVMAGSLIAGIVAVVVMRRAQQMPPDADAIAQAA
jgi:NhaA family Na+:H+ antiporter